MKVDILELLKFIVAAGGAGAVIGGIIKPILNLVKKVDRLEKNQHETYMQTLRLVIMSEEMPLEERIKAGDEYIKKGGNGAVRHFYEEQLLTRLSNKN